MPALNFLGIDLKPSSVKLNGQVATVTLPPLMKQDGASDSLASDLQILPGEEGKIYIIHAFKVGVKNNAGTAATVLNLMYSNFWTGKVQSLCGVDITPNAVGAAADGMTGLNIPTFPGQPVTLVIDAAPLIKWGKVFYTEVRI